MSVTAVTACDSTAVTALALYFQYLSLICDTVTPLFRKFMKQKKGESKSAVTKNKKHPSKR